MNVQLSAAASSLSWSCKVVPPAYEDSTELAALFGDYSAVKGERRVCTYLFDMVIDETVVALWRLDRRLLWKICVLWCCLWHYRMPFENEYRHVAKVQCVKASDDDERQLPPGNDSSMCWRNIFMMVTAAPMIRRYK